VLPEVLQCDSHAYQILPGGVYSTKINA
jgi:hypothetical protein